MHAAREIAQERKPREHATEHEKDRESDRRREADDKVLETRIHDTLGACVNHRRLKMRAKGHARARGSEQLEKQCVNKLMRGERGTRNHDGADHPAENRRQPGIKRRVEVGRPSNQHKQRYRAGSEEHDHDKAPRDARVKEPFVLECMYVGNLFHAIQHTRPHAHRINHVR